MAVARHIPAGHSHLRVKCGIAVPESKSLLKWQVDCEGTDYDTQRIMMYEAVPTGLITRLTAVRP